jgi:hypothetical protein
MSGMYLQGYWYRIQSWSDGEETAKVQNTVVELERRQDRDESGDWQQSPPPPVGGSSQSAGVQVSMAARGNSQVYDGTSKRGISGPGTSRRRTSPGGTEGTGNSDYWNPRKQLLGVESLLLDLN